MIAKSAILRLVSHRATTKADIMLTYTYYTMHFLIVNRLNSRPLPGKISKA